MRVALGMFGLVGLLVVTAIILVSFTRHTSQVVTTGTQAREEVAQVAGVGETGMRATESATLEPQGSGSRPQSLLVTQLSPGGPMATYFGLKQYDAVVEVGTQAGPTKVRDFNSGDEAVAFAFQAYQYKLPLIVMRNGQRVQLPGGTPAEGNPGTPTPDPAAAAAPAQPGSASPPTATPQPTRSNVWDQVRGIPGVERPSE
ncbi:MAG TPA: hypothetical protein VK324_06515 [Tepidisphaeraceae bacterium]|nr:hypothetical protein [Tepidisphaeraceae bacterium]